MSTQPFDFDRAANAHRRLGRNEACWCGSGRKYKRCHLRRDEEIARTGLVEGRPKLSAILMERCRNILPSDATVTQVQQRAQLLALAWNLSRRDRMDEAERRALEEELAAIHHDLFDALTAVALEFEARYPDDPRFIAHVAAERTAKGDVTLHVGQVLFGGEAAGSA